MYTTVSIFSLLIHLQTGYLTSVRAPGSCTRSTARTEVYTAAAGRRSYHVPDKIGQPVDDGLHSADELQVLCFADPLLDQEHDEAGRNEGHRKDNTDGHEDIHRCGHPGNRKGNEDMRGP